METNDNLVKAIEDLTEVTFGSVVQQTRIMELLSSHYVLDLTVAMKLHGITLQDLDSTLEALQASAPDDEYDNTSEDGIGPQNGSQTHTEAMNELGSGGVITFREGSKRPQ